MAVKTQGTEMYFLDPVAEVWTKIGCPTSVSLVSPTKGEIDITCLDSEAPESMAGFGEAGSATFDIIPDPQDPSHVRLNQLQQEGETLQWAIGWSDGDAVPTVDSSGDPDLPSTRTWNTLKGHLTNFPFDFQNNEVVRTSGLTINVSGQIGWTPKVAGP